ncbi:Wiskott-Aldrich syndrome protein family member 3 [Trichinella spiralis]|uniref:Wiskott-Aldrich syndrome protein family member 3 n=1 Tax=Trichinella spiralis TaxID=6334 RepID=A0A0V1AK79_TRISP|nr:Wiskott-Aldrich syndrome protein family member 3 [Trichinella spiralis]
MNLNKQNRKHRAKLMRTGQRANNSVATVVVQYGWIVVVEMPLTKREVSPVLLCRHRLPSGVRDKELQCIANGTLANLIRQLGSLSSHAEDLFAELSKDLIKIEHRTNLLQTRLDSLGQKVNDLDSGIDESTQYP